MANNVMKWYRRRSDPVRAFQYLDSMRINDNLPEGVTIVSMGGEDVPVYNVNGMEVVLNHGDWVVFQLGKVTFMEDKEFHITYKADPDRRSLGEDIVSILLNYSLVGDCEEAAEQILDLLKGEHKSCIS